VVIGTRHWYVILLLLAARSGTRHWRFVSGLYKLAVYDSYYVVTLAFFAVDIRVHIDRRGAYLLYPVAMDRTAIPAIFYDKLSLRFIVAEKHRYVKHYLEIHFMLWPFAE
jgi:hypothetical protein